MLRDIRSVGPFKTVIDVTKPLNLLIWYTYESPEVYDMAFMVETISSQIGGVSLYI